MKELRSAAPSTAPDLLKTYTEEFTTSTMSAGPTAMSGSGGMNSWSVPKLWIALACPMPANPFRLSGAVGVIKGPDAPEWELEERLAAV